jgi:hypothetical protein
MQQQNLPSNLEQQPQPQQAAYVISHNTGHSAHPDQIIASCQALQAHLQKLQGDAIATMQKWQDDIKERELMEKRRVAPGWLDVDQKMLVPERREQPHHAGSPASRPHAGGSMGVDSQVVPDGGEELDRAFGGLGLK